MGSLESTANDNYNLTTMIETISYVKEAQNRHEQENEILRDMPQGLNLFFNTKSPDKPFR